MLKLSGKPFPSTMNALLMLCVRAPRCQTINWMILHFLILTSCQRHKMKFVHFHTISIWNTSSHLLIKEMVELIEIANWALKLLLPTCFCIRRCTRLSTRTPLPPPLVHNGSIRQTTILELRRRGLLVLNLSLGRILSPYLTVQTLLPLSFNIYQTLTCSQASDTSQFFHNVPSNESVRNRSLRGPGLRREIL